MPDHQDGYDDDDVDDQIDDDDDDDDNGDDEDDDDEEDEDEVTQQLPHWPWFLTSETAPWEKIIWLLSMFIFWKQKKRKETKKHIKTKKNRQ